MKKKLQSSFPARVIAWILAAGVTFLAGTFLMSAAISFYFGGSGSFLSSSAYNSLELEAESTLTDAAYNAGFLASGSEDLNGEIADNLDGAAHELENIGVSWIITDGDTGAVLAQSDSEMPGSGDTFTYTNSYEPVNIDEMADALTWTGSFPPCFYVYSGGNLTRLEVVGRDDLSLIAADGDYDTETDLLDAFLDDTLYYPVDLYTLAQVQSFSCNDGLIDICYNADSTIALSAPLCMKQEYTFDAVSESCVLTYWDEHDLMWDTFDAAADPVGAMQLSSTGELFFDTDPIDSLLLEDDTLTLTIRSYTDWVPSNNIETSADEYDTVTENLIVRYALTGGEGTRLEAAQNNYDRYAQNFGSNMRAAMFCGLFVLLCLVFLCWNWGHVRGRDGIVIRGIDRLWFEPLFLLWLALALVLFLLTKDIIVLLWEPSYTGTYLDNYALVGDTPAPSLALLCLVSGCAALLEAVIGLVLLRTGVVRLKSRTMKEHLFVTWLFRAVKRGISWIREQVAGNVRLSILCIALYIIYALLCAFFYDLFSRLGHLWALFPLTVIHVGIVAWILYIARCLSRMHEKLKKVRDGDFSGEIDPKSVSLFFRPTANDLNDLTGSISRSAEKQMKSERLRNELLTNVSHDLKTPLTSIISYIDLLQDLDPNDPKAKEYYKVLSRKSLQLRRLTEDLVDASKASSGALRVEPTKIDLCTLMGQCAAEYDDRLTASNLKVVFRTEQRPLYILADGRHLWRVADNLLNNCVKYAMPGTRVYIDSRVEGNYAVAEIKNVSAEPLSRSPDELMERFTRGDVSRTTEGHGLGLSIAMSLMTLQNGTLDLDLDGDLFKVILRIPLAEEEEKA